MQIQSYLALSTVLQFSRSIAHIITVKTNPSGARFFDPDSHF